VPVTPDPDVTIRDELRRMFAAEDVVTTDARRRGQRAMPPEPAEAALLGWFAARTAHGDGPNDIVEVGSAGGVSSIWLARGLADGATLTSIDADADLHALASEAVEVAGLGERVRSILGEPAEILPRLTDGRYGLCLLQCPPEWYAALLPEVLRILAPGGLLIARRILSRGEHGRAIARLLAEIAEDESLHATVLEEHDGLLLVKRH